MRISDWSSDVCSSDLRNGHARMFANAHEIDMQGPVRHWMESDILRQRARGFAADIDHDHTIHEIAGAEQLVQRLFLDVNHHRFLIVAINYGGHANIAAQGTGGSLASPFARLGRQRKLIAHKHVYKPY